MKCKTHPKYKVVHKPRCACESCWALWFYDFCMCNLDYYDLVVQPLLIRGDLRDE